MLSLFLREGWGSCLKIKSIWHHMMNRILVISRTYCYLLTYSLTYLLTHSINQSPAQSLNHSITHSLTYSLTCSLIHSLNHSLIHLLAHLLTHSMEQSSSWEANWFSASQVNPHTMYFIEPEGSLSHLQMPATWCPCPEPDQSSSYPIIPLPEDPS
jgi:hypothetical protein